MERRKRREYLLKKENEQKEKLITHNKKILKSCIATNQKIPHDLRTHASELLEEMFFEIKDDLLEPEIILPLITTSRDPSDKLKHFARRLAHTFNTTTIMRGSKTTSELEAYMRRSQYNALIILTEARGVPNGLSLVKFPHGPTYNFNIINPSTSDFRVNGNALFVCDNIGIEVQDDDDTQVKSDVDKKTSLQAEENAYNDIKNIFSKIFACTEKNLDNKKNKRGALLSKKNGYLCFRHYCGEKSEGFDLKMYEVIRGTLEGGEREWVYQPFMNSSRKREYS